MISEKTKNAIWTTIKIVGMLYIAGLIQKM